MLHLCVFVQAAMQMLLRGRLIAFKQKPAALKSTIDITTLLVPSEMTLKVRETLRTYVVFDSVLVLNRGGTRINLHRSQDLN